MIGWTKKLLHAGVRLNRETRATRFWLYTIAVNVATFYYSVGQLRILFFFYFKVVLAVLIKEQKFQPCLRAE